MASSAVSIPYSHGPIDPDPLSSRHYTSRMTAKLLTLPLEVFREILLNLELIDIVNLGSTSSKLKALILDDKNYVWRLLAQRDLFIFDAEPPHPYPSFWHMYVRGISPFHWMKTDLWIDDQTPFGEIYVSKYDRSSASLCLCKLLCRKMDDAETHTSNTAGEPGQQTQQRPPDLVSASVFLSAMTNQQRAEGTDTNSNDFNGHTIIPNQPQQLPSDPSVTLFPNQVDIVTFGPYIRLNQYTERDQSGIWKWRSWGDVDTGARVGLMRAIAIAPANLNRSMSVWPPFKIPAKDRTRNTSRNNFLGHYSPSPELIEHSNVNRSQSPPALPQSPTIAPRHPWTEIPSTPSATIYRDGISTHYFNYRNLDINQGATTFSNANTSSIINFHLGNSSRSHQSGRNGSMQSNSTSTTSTTQHASPSPDLFRLQRMTKLESLHGPVESLFRLSSDLYTPTSDFPYRGIWVSGKSSEFQLFHQPNMNTIEAIKLTGGTHVKRGEYNFLVSDLNSSLPSTYPEWPDAKIVEGHSQVAEFNFVNRKSDSQSSYNNITNISQHTTFPYM